jgi:hypothetical protein
MAVTAAVRYWAAWFHSHSCVLCCPVGHSPSLVSYDTPERFIVSELTPMAKGCSPWQMDTVTAWRPRGRWPHCLTSKRLPVALTHQIAELCGCKEHGVECFLDTNRGRWLWCTEVVQQVSYVTTSQPVLIHSGGVSDDRYGLPHTVQHSWWCYCYV